MDGLKKCFGQTLLIKILDTKSLFEQKATVHQKSMNKSGISVPKPMYFLWEQFCFTCLLVNPHSQSSLGKELVKRSSLLNHRRKPKSSGNEIDFLAKGFKTLETLF